MEEPRIRTEEQLHEAMARVSFEKSCIDMGWQWEVQPVFVPAGDVARVPDGATIVVARDIDLRPGDTIAGKMFTLAWRLRCSFRRPERDSGEVGTGFGRWWEVEPGVTESGLWKTMHLAVKTNVEHELLEAYKVDGRRPFDPHRSIHDLVGLPLPPERGGAP